MLPTYLRSKYRSTSTKDKSSNSGVDLLHKSYSNLTATEPNRSMLGVCWLTFLRIAHERLGVLPCDVLNAASVNQAVAGQDVVLV